MATVSSEPGVDSRTKMKSRPIALEVPVVATGARPGDPSQKRELFREETETVLVLEHGAVIRLSAAVAVGQLVFLTNKQSGKEIVTQVLRKRNFRPTACYVELDFAEPALGFWGVEFPRAEADAKPNLPESGEAAEVAEAEITEEEFGQPAAPPGEAEIATLRREVEALKSQPESLPPAPEGEPEATKPEAVKLEIMSPHEPKPEPVKSEATRQEEAGTGQRVEAQDSPSYPIRMQLPKAVGTSNRSSEFAADSAAITAAMEENLLPKPSLDFERFPGVAEPTTKLFSGKATKGLSGPIGAMVAAVLFLTAGGIATYRFGWLPKFGNSSKSAAGKSAVTPLAGANPRTAPTEPSENLNTAKTDTAANEKPVSVNRAPLTTLPVVAANPPVEGSAVGKRLEESAPAKSNVRSLPVRPSVQRGAKSAAEPSSVAGQGEDVIVPPKLVKAIRSLSPPEALWRYTSGNVVLDALVDETGHVESATVISGPKALHERAITTVKEYLYQPATKNGKPVPAHVEVKIQFWYEP